jgi:MFS family permease
MGQRGVALIGPTCHLIAYVVNCTHPPYPVLVISFIFAGFGNGLEDAAWNAWIGNMANANELLGFLHGVYGAGAVLSPLIATSMITRANLPWYFFYYVMVSSSSLSPMISYSVAFLGWVCRRRACGLRYFLLGQHGRSVPGSKLSLNRR